MRSNSRSSTAKVPLLLKYEELGHRTFVRRWTEVECVEVDFENEAQTQLINSFF